MDDGDRDPNAEILEETSRSGEHFVKVFYQLMDSRRHKLPALYSPESNFIWNGSGVRGQNHIAAFLERLPTSVHRLKSLAVQPLLDHDLLIVVVGHVEYTGRPAQQFQQTFTVRRPRFTSTGEKAFIASDAFRFVDGTL